jgi:hypothetical protein
MTTASLPLLPPTHIIDAPGLYISPSDPAWDHKRAEVELAELAAKGRENGRAAWLAEHGKGRAPEGLAPEESAALDDAGEEAARQAKASHPVLRYAAGLTRYQIDAADWTADGKACTARDYLRPDATPCRFTLIRPNRKRLRAVDGIDDTWDRREALIRAVVRRIDGPDGSIAWTPANDAEEVPERILEAMASWAPALIRQLADACAAYCRPLREHELPR